MQLSTPFFFLNTKESPTFGARWAGGTSPRWRGRGVDMGRDRNGFARQLYDSYAWQKCRATVWRRAGGLCEKCLVRGLIVPGVEVHHIKHLTPENVSDPAIALNPDNLILLCAACHHDEHEREVRYRTDEQGRIIW